jgi:hypothetical protein
MIVCFACVEVVEREVVAAGGNLELVPFPVVVDDHQTVCGAHP